MSLSKDEYQRVLTERVHPTDWQAPKPADRYHLVVVGAGTAGLVTAAGAASLGARVALIERDLMGGDCLNTGCVPSKALLRAARAVAAVQNAAVFGVEIAGSVNIDFKAVMQRMRQLRAQISSHDSAERFRELGVDVFFGQGLFSGFDSVHVGENCLRFKKAVIATGARAAVADIPGLKGVEYLTNETVFSLSELPGRFLVVGAGPIGCELAQAFARFGSRVHLIESTHGILPREDRDAAEVLVNSLRKDGVQLRCCSRELTLANSPEGIRVCSLSHDTPQEIVVDRVLLAVGRSPNVERLQLEAAGVEYDLRAGVRVNDQLQTTNPRIYAAGDVCSQYKFTHAADAMARIVIGNALFGRRSKASRLIIPWCTYTSPEIARIGLSGTEAEAAGIAIETFVQPLAEIDRAILDGQSEGFVRVHVRRGTDQLLGATVVAERAGELIGELSLAMTHGVGLKKIAATIHPYPTESEAIRRLGDQYNRTRLTPLVKSLLAKWLAWKK
jgi:pyruvate/2-oxoglutarate dehydrogenase complex dihydrolipoamide dehydrogenase (E3) component